jgi:hypothetical protein
LRDIHGRIQWLEGFRNIVIGPVASLLQIDKGLGDSR